MKQLLRDVFGEMPRWRTIRARLILFGILTAAAVAVELGVIVAARLAN